MVKWKKLNKKVAGVLLGVMVLFSASTTAFAYVDPSAETTNTEAAQTETVQNKETEKPADEGVLPENNKTEKKEDAFTEPGNGEVQDDIQNGSSKEFLTITTKNNNTFSTNITLPIMFVFMGLTFLTNAKECYDKGAKKDAMIFVGIAIFVYVVTAYNLISRLM